MPDVVGINRDQRCIESARAHPGANGIRYLAGDFLAWRCPPESFDVIAAVASLHHMNTPVALRRMRYLLRPGGLLGIIGLARGSSPVNVALTVPAAIGVRCHAHGTAGPRSRSTSTPHPYADRRRPAIGTSADSPGCCYPAPGTVGNMYWRYSPVWIKPAASFPA